VRLKSRHRPSVYGKYGTMMAEERKLFGSKETGRVYTIEKILNKGLVILRTEDGFGTALVHEGTFEIHFIKEENEKEKNTKSVNGEG
jgi:hypothetical protein